MQRIIHLLAILGVLVLGLFRTGEVRAATEDEEKAQTIAIMRKLSEALTGFKKGTGQYPDFLTDLVPKYFPDAGALLSPTEKRTGRHGDNGQSDPRSRTSFCYEFSAQKFGNSSLTFRELKEKQVEEFGQVVPIVRCFLYDRVLNLACSGDIFESALYWESSDEAKALMASIGLGPGFKESEYFKLKVVDSEKHQPIENAEVRLTDRVYHALPLPDRTLRTQADGTTLVPLGPSGPSARKLTYTVFKPGFYAPPRAWKKGDGENDVTMELDHGAEIGGIVKSHDGRPLAGAEITVLHLEPDKAQEAIFVQTPLSTQTTDEAGRWKCTRVPKKFMGIAVCVKHPSAWTSWSYSSNEAGPGKVLRSALIAGTAEILVERAVEIRGMVTAADGQPAAGAEVMVRPVYRKPPHQIAERTTVTRPRTALAPVKTDAAGRYAIPWHEDANVVLMVFPAEGAPARAKFEAAPDMKAEDIRLDKGRVIKGRVTSDDGKPVAGAEILLASWEGTALPQRKVVAKTDESGNFTWNSAPAGSLMLHPRADGFTGTFKTIGEAAEDEPLVELTLRKQP